MCLLVLILSFLLLVAWIPVILFNPDQLPTDLRYIVLPLFGLIATYAFWWIKQAMGRATAEKSRTVRMPVHVWEKLTKIKKA